jgi:hypothetical protein
MFFFRFSVVHEFLSAFDEYGSFGVGLISLEGSSEYANLGILNSLDAINMIYLK